MTPPTPGLPVYQHCLADYSSQKPGGQALGKGVGVRHGEGWGKEREEVGENPVHPLPFEFFLLVCLLLCLS